ncbi:MAG TPA: flagellar basal body P-ring formation chaperone FlgA [Lacipirellula sp.]
MLIKTLITIAVANLAVAVSAAEIVLHERTAPRGPIVRLGDVATISGVEGGAQQMLAATPLMPAPAEGTTQYLRAADLRDLLQSRGVDLRNLQMSGAPVVAIGGASEVEFQVGRTQAVARVAASAEELTNAVVSYLEQQTGHQLWDVQVEADSDVLAAFAKPQAAISGGKAPWSGRQRFAISSGAGTPAAMVYARVDRQEMAAYATRSIERGELIRRADVELRLHTGALPRQAIFDLESLVGKEAVQGIRPDSLVLNNQVRSPLLVRRGDRVSVRVRARGIAIRTFAVAQQDGSLGELVSVQNADTKEKYTAVVSGLRELEIMAAGATAADLASAPAREVR